jgi:hypothetical protein
MSPRSRSRRLALATAAALGLLAGTAHAETFDVGSPAWESAIGASVAHWGTMPCGGVVEYAWTDLPSGVIGYASWSRPSSAPSDPSRFSKCRVELDPDLDLGPGAFCTVLAHELGHLLGHDHVADPGDLMAEHLGEPLPACVTAMAPYAPAPEPPAGPAASPPASSKPSGPSAASRSKITRKRAKAKRSRSAQRANAQVRRGPRR